jgi:HD-GYP domain-containing protein (c-di-GMP phosphodiesterase class II)
MAAYARILAERLGLPDAECELIFRAGPLHDVGKIGVPDAILLKPGPLTDAERAVMERHAQAGHDLLRDSHSELLQLGAVIALHHHERWDGAGYPNRLRAEEIPLAARIVAVADVFDALTTDRVYRPAMPFEDAVAIVRNGRGSHFDPLVVDAFLAALDEFARVSLGLQERARRNPRGEAAELPPREDRPVGAER